MSTPPPAISVVISALNEGANLRKTVESFQATLPEASEIVVVDDGSADGSPDSLPVNGNLRLIRANHIGVARARNLGARNTTGNILVFSDAHIAMPAGWWEPMLEVLANPAAGGAAPCITDMTDTDCRGFGLELAGPNPSESWLEKQSEAPFQAALLPWCSTAMRRDTFEATGGFDPGMICWGSIDNEMSVRLWLLGYELWVIPSVEVRHVFREKRPYPIEWSWALHNKLRLSFVHFHKDRITRVVEALSEHQGFPEAVALLADGDVSSRRAEIASRRVHDAEWFFERFGPRW